MIFTEYIVIALIGGLGYGGLEILFRGRTHWTMLAAGAVCFLLIYQINRYSRENHMKKWLMGAFVITAVEFLTGAAVNLVLDWQVWDYSSHRFNLMGQICPLFSCFWFLLCIPLEALCKYLREIFHGKAGDEKAPDEIDADRL